MVAIKSTPNRRVHCEEPPAWFQILQHSLECKRQPIDVLKASNGENQVVLTLMVIAKVFNIAIEMTVSRANLEEPLLFSKVAMKLIGFAELFIIGRRFNSSPAIATKMVDYK